MPYTGYPLAPSHNRASAVLPPPSAPPTPSIASLAALPSPPSAITAAASFCTGSVAATTPQIRWVDVQGAAPGMSSSASSVEGDAAGEFTEVVIVRHGETSWNASRIIQGHLDAELNDIGRQQAVAVVFDPALRERHIGDLQGMTLQDAATERPEAYKAFMSHKRNQQVPGGGESLDQLSERCVSFLYDIVGKHKDTAAWVVLLGMSKKCYSDVLPVRLMNPPPSTDTGERVILVSHGGTIRELYRHASPTKPLHGKIHNTSVSVILVSDATGRCIVKMCGDVSHLQETGVLENAFGGDKTSA
ncbi:Phosphoglycerate mutase-like protein 4 [Zea mays]|uniref:Phosphoglycerate mutase-like protein 4 n=1 Tax=Zea mays TaxID=4577 RepID=A0A317YF55_MAIZE|nr:Phosphoglycerate mutase-like protein 4 [Zea mays]